MDGSQLGDGFVLATQHFISISLTQRDGYHLYPLFQYQTFHYFVFLIFFWLRTGSSLVLGSQRLGTMEPWRRPFANHPAVVGNAFLSRAWGRCFSPSKKLTSSSICIPGRLDSVSGMAEAATMAIKSGHGKI
jgi:hypothetical protein